MVEGIFTELSTAGQSFVTFLTNTLQSVFGIFGGNTGTNNAFELTNIGKITIAGVAIGFVYFGIRWITRLIKLRA